MVTKYWKNFLDSTSVAYWLVNLRVKHHMPTGAILARMTLIDSVPESVNDWADYWRYHIGVNTIPADSRKKAAYIYWKKYQDASISDWQYEKWKQEGAFSKGIAIIPGKMWHRKNKKGLYFVSIDADKLLL